MTEKRFVHIEHKGADYILDNPNWDLDYIEMLGDTLEPEEIVDLLNKFVEENERLKTLLEIKRKENQNRVLALQEITDKYTNEVLFKNNVNPNDAVKQVLKEILSSKVKEYD